MSEPAAVELLSVVERLRELGGRFPDVHLDNQAEAAASAAIRTALTLVVVGEIKKGKSSLINALLSDPGASPTATDVATSVALRFEAGAPGLCVESYPGSDGVTPARQLIDRGQLDGFCTESGNPGNARMVDCVVVSHPARFLSDGFVLMDTPGLGGLYRNHSTVTWRHVPNADVVLFVLDSAEAVMSRHEIEYLQRIAKLGKPIFFVQTKRDLADTAQVAAWMKRNLAIIADALGKPAGSIPYFCVSAALQRKSEAEANPALKARLAQRSGFGDLTKFLREKLMPAACKQRRDGVAKDLATRVAAAIKSARERVAVTTASAGDETVRLEAEHAERKRELAEWLANEVPQLRKRFANDIADFQRIALRDLRERLALTPANPLWTETVAAIDQAAQQGRTQQVPAEELLEGLRERCGDATVEILERFRRVTSDALAQLGERLDLAVGREPVPLEEASSVRDRTEIAIEIVTDAEAQTGQLVENVLTSLSLATGLGGMVGHAVFPGLGFVTGAVVLWWVTSRKHRIVQEREAALWRAKITEAAQHEVRAVLGLAQQVAEDISVTARRVGDDWLDRCMAQRRQQVSELQTSLTEAKARTREQGKAAAEAAKRDLATLQDLSQQLQAIVSGRPATGVKAALDVASGIA